METSPNFSPLSLSVLIEELTADFTSISSNRRALLRPLIQSLRDAFRRSGTAQVIVICTHNSRRSHIGQLWLEAASRSYHSYPIQSFSGGTEATAFYPSAIQALQDAGFPLHQKTGGTNPTYQCQWEKDTTQATPLFSKVYDTPPNPTRDFIALLVCDSAAEACPYVAGATNRIILPYDDPKHADGTPQEAQAYADKVREIGREMLWVMDRLVNEAADSDGFLDLK